jgi:hypothetical protein
MRRKRTARVQPTGTNQPPSVDFCVVDTCGLILLTRPDRAMSMANVWNRYKAALHADPFCYEALEQLLENHMYVCFGVKNLPL